MDAITHELMISVTGLTRKFGDLVAVDHLNLEIPRGEIFGLVGPDGAGKTTTLRLICGLMNPTEGRVIVAGEDVATNIDAVKDRIGYMAQRFGLYQDLTVEENLDFYGDLFGVADIEREELKLRLLKMTRMEPFRDRPAGKLSGGMKQKLALMCTLLHHPQVLFLDEPTNGVDPVSRRDFWTILYDLVKGGLTVFVTTAYLDEAERCDRVGMLHHGRMIQMDTPAKLRTSLEEVCFDIAGADSHATREALEAIPGVLSVEPAGATMHLFAASSVTVAEIERASGGRVRRITPSLEDVFIAMVRKQELRDAA
jgi:ABC-2 type transport system ATP-binding protein